MTRRWLAALAAAIVGLSGCGGGGDRRPPAAREPALRFGVVANTLANGTRLGRQQDLAQGAGARWLREELVWADIEPRPGVLRWGLFDRMLVAASHRGLRVLPLLNHAPAWAAPADGGVPTDAAAYAAFVHAAVARYGAGGAFWRAHPALRGDLAPRWFELWNEPYLVAPLDGSVDARRYAALVVAGVAAGRAAAPGSRYLMAVDAPSDRRPTEARRWLDRLLAAQPDLLSRVDGVAAHPYAGDGLESVRALARVAAALAARGRPQPIWVTEVGWSTCEQSDGCVSPTAQAGDLATFLAGVEGGPLARRVAALFLYSLQDLRAQRGGYEGSFGLLFDDDRRKPSWAVARRFADGLQRRAAAAVG